MNGAPRAVQIKEYIIENILTPLFLFSCIIKHMMCFGLELLFFLIFLHPKEPLSTINSAAALSPLHLKLFPCDLLQHILKETQLYIKTFDIKVCFWRRTFFTVNSIFLWILVRTTEIEMPLSTLWPPLRFWLIKLRFLSEYINSCSASVQILLSQNPISDTGQKQMER